MDWGKIKAEGYMEVDGNRLNLSHLQDAKYRFDIPASRNYPKLSFSVLVQYSSHCVSWGPSHGQEIDFIVHGTERRIVDEKGIHRCFCDKRHRYSVNLPGIFKSLPERKCFFTGHSNWLTIEIIGSCGNPLEYEVFFSLTKQSRNLLRVYVESAYVRDPDSPGNRPVNFRHRDKVRAKVLLAKKLRGEPIRRPSHGNRRN